MESSLGLDAVRWDHEPNDQLCVAYATQSWHWPRPVHGEPPRPYGPAEGPGTAQSGRGTKSADKSDVLQTLRAGRVGGPRDSVWSACVFSAAFESLLRFGRRTVHGEPRPL